MTAPETVPHSDGTARPMGALMLLGAIGSNIAEYRRPRRG